MLLLILSTIAVVFLFYYFIIKPYSYWKDRGVKQGNPIWILGDAWGQFFRIHSFADMVQMVYYQCPGTRYSGMYQFSVPSFVVKDPELIKRITVKDFDHFVDHMAVIPDTADPLWGKNLLSLKGQKWRDMRSILSPSFTSSKMRTMFSLMEECAEDFVQHFLNKKEDIITVEFKDIFTRYTSNVIASTAFGIKIDSLAEPNNKFYLMGREATDFSGFWKLFKLLGYLIFPTLYKHLKVKFFSDEVSNFFQGIVKDTIKMREEKGIVRQDMINLLMEASKGIHRQDDIDVIDTGFSTAQESNLGGGKSKSPKELTDMDIAAQAMVFFFAGFDTASGLMCFLAYELAANPDIQDRLRDEVRSTIEECGGKLNYESLLKMKYMDMVVSETLRKWPISGMTDRRCTKTYTIPPARPDENSVTLEIGTVIFLPIYGLHHDAEYYPDPERFDPDRFSDENKGNIKPYTYFPFGLGPRNCIGSRFALLEAKAVIFHVLKHFEIVPVEKSKIPLRLCKKQFTLSADGGFWFGLKRIKT